MFKKKILYSLTILFIFFIALKIFTLNSVIGVSFWNIDSQIITLQKNNHIVTLLAMIHTADPKYYNQIKNSYINQNYLVLLEGINQSDKNKEKKTISQDNLSKLLGLSKQNNNLIFEGYNTINSDIFIDSFSDNTLYFLFNLFESIDYLSMGDFKKAKIYYNNSKEIPVDIIKKEIIYDRNKIVLDNIYKNKANKLLVPWGAIHIIGIKEDLIKNGYQIVSSDRIVAFNWIYVIFNLMSVLFK